MMPPYPPEEGEIRRGDPPKPKEWRDYQEGVHPWIPEQVMLDRAMMVQLQGLCWRRRRELSRKLEYALARWHYPEPGDPGWTGASSAAYWRNRSEFEALGRASAALQKQWEESVGWPTYNRLHAEEDG